MADWRTGVGDPDGSSQSASTTRFIAILGGYAPKTPESRAEIIVRRAYTFSGMFVRVIANTTSAASTDRFRINNGDGNQFVTIPAGTSGTFEDLVRSDSLSVGDRINSELVTGAGGSVTTTAIAYNVNFSAFEPLIGISGARGATPGLTRFHGIIGGTTAALTEADVQYRVRFAATYRNFQFVSENNTLDGASTVRLRVDGADVNQFVTVPATTSGTFEDLVNTDMVESGNLVNFTTLPGGAAGSLTITNITEQVENARVLGQGEVPGSTIGFGVNSFYPMESEHSLSTVEVEADVQVKAGVTFDAVNYFVLITTNTLNGASTVTFRVNGADSALAVTIPATTEGEFEDLVTRIAVDENDLINHLLATGGSSGGLRQAFIGFQMQAPPIPEDLPPGTLLLPA